MNPAIQTIIAVSSATTAALVITTKETSFTGTQFIGTLLGALVLIALGLAWERCWPWPLNRISRQFCLLVSLVLLGGVLLLDEPIYRLASAIGSWGASSVALTLALATTIRWTTYHGTAIILVWAVGVILAGVAIVFEVPVAWIWSATFAAIAQALLAYLARQASKAADLDRAVHAGLGG